MLRGKLPWGFKKKTEKQHDEDNIKPKEKVQVFVNK